MIQPVDKIVAYLRTVLTDYNSTARSAAGLSSNWIYPDRPLVKNMLGEKNNFPRIGIWTLPESTLEKLAMDDTENYDLMRFQGEVVTVKKLVCTTVSTTDESHVFSTGTNDYLLSNAPVTHITSVTGTLSGSPYTFGLDVDYSLVDSDDDMHSDTIRWLDHDKPDNGTTFYVDYERNEHGWELAHHIVRDIKKALRENWETNTLLEGLYNPRFMMQPVDIDEDIGIFRYQIEIQFEGINLGE